MSKEHYFERYAWQPPIMPDYVPPEDLEMVIVVPAYKEPDLLSAISSLLNCTPIPCKMVVLVVINGPEDGLVEDLLINQQSYDALQNLSTGTLIQIKAIQIYLPKKKAGVGLARKIGMDEAARWFKKLNKSGIIVSYDADCRCSPDYLSCIHNAYKNKKLQASVIYYEHPLDEESGIIAYELGLRYYIDALRYSGYPHAYQTLGSCMTIKSAHYCKYGGMNTRKAGEDFYFLNKMAIQPGFFELNNTTVYPSARISDRVPFGTGRALGNYLSHPNEPFSTYHPQIFKDLKSFLYVLPHLAKKQKIALPEAIETYLDSISFSDQLTKLLKNSANDPSFFKQFFGWFDAFLILKYVHFARDNYYENIDLSSALSSLNTNYWRINAFDKMVVKDQLMAIRTLNRRPLETY